MADIRIKDLAVTAGSSASDDYLAVDGSTNGTRKLSAYSPTFGGNVVATGTLTINSTTDSSSKDTGAIITEGGLGVEKSGTFGGNLSVTGTINGTTGVTSADLTLGTSGPSVKSSLSARAPRQGLVFDGTAGTTVANVPAFGTGNFTVAAWINKKDLATYGVIFGGATGAFELYVNITDGKLRVINIDTAINGESSTGIQAGKWAFVTYTRSGGSAGTFYINGIAAGTITEGSPNYSTAVSQIGRDQSGSYFDGAIAPFIYNRALSASEVVSLYEAGAPAGADYNSASNTAVYSTDFSSSTGWSLGGSTTISGGKLNLVNNDFAGAPSSTELVIGKRYRFTITVDSITAGNVSYFNGAAYVSFATSAGTYTVDFTAAGSYSFFTLRSDGGNAVCDTFAFYKTGLLLAPDAAQAGGGYVWNDQSGNLAQIVLPSSGVQWALPSVAGQRIRGTTSTNGNQQLLGASVLLPAECQITHVRARARSGTPTITIGTASGGAQIVASVALSTTWLNCTIALTGGIVSSADDIWVGSNSTDVVETDIAFQPLDF